MFVKAASVTYLTNTDIKAVTLERATSGSNALGYPIHVTLLGETLFAFFQLEVQPHWTFVKITMSFQGRDTGRWEKLLNTLSLTSFFL